MNSNKAAFQMGPLIKNYMNIDGCWIHNNSPMKNGYIQLRDSERKKHLAHRLSYIYYNGFIDLNLKVCHTCDHPSCVNPEHLFLGTQADNMKDKVKKGRQGKPGVEQISEDDEAFITYYRSKGLTYSEISILVGVSIGTVGRYLRKERTHG